MSRHQVSSILSALQPHVFRLETLEAWLRMRLERLEQLNSFQEILPEVLKVALSYYRDAVRALLQLTRAYVTDEVLHACEKFYAEDAADLENFAKFLCYCSIPRLTRRSHITHFVTKSVIENIFCPYQLYLNKFSKYQVTHKIAEVVDEGQRNGIDNCFELYREGLKDWCDAPYCLGEHFKHGEHLKSKLRGDLEEIHEPISWLECAIKALNDRGVQDVASSNRDILDIEPPRGSLPMSRLDRLKSMNHRLACSRRVFAFTEQVLVFCSTGWRFASLENSQEGQDIEVLSQT